MSRIAPRRYQQDAVAQTLEIFRHAESQIREAANAAGRRLASAYNGCVLLEAPTGAGKTLMAGMIAEAFSQPDRADNAHILWFWFTPFKGLVEQARGALKQDFAGLRMRDLQIDRIARNARSGDVFVTTWAAVAANNADTRQVRRGGDAAVALDDFIAQLRQDGFRIGAVVDEAHHTFFKSGTEAGRFYGEVLCPDFTLMVTATPNDRDVDRFKVASGVIEVHRNTVSRRSAVEAGLIKAGVKAVAFLANPAQASIINFAEIALREAWSTHQRIKQALHEAGIDLTPLMLVQVGNLDQAVKEAKALLLGLGVPEECIASYTAKEPTNDLLAVALDERFEVLIFKVAVALGFDAPRAFVLASLRSSKETDFGIQVVGRILRVHRRLQPATLDRTLPPGLNYGYVFLADAENQTGLASAGERINAVRDELARICPATMLFRVGDETQIQVTENGQGSLLWVAPESAGGRSGQQRPETAVEDGGRDGEAAGTADPRPFVLDLFGDPPTETLGVESVIRDRLEVRRQAAPTPGLVRHSLRTDAERRLKTERMSLSTAELLGCIAARIGFDETVINAGLRDHVSLTRKTLEIFAGDTVQDETRSGLDAKVLAHQTQTLLCHYGYLDSRDLHHALLGRLQTEFRHRGFKDDPENLKQALDLILATYPKLLRQAERECASRFKEVVETGDWPEMLDAPAGTEPSPRNVYGVMPEGLNRLERALVQLLDADLSGVVEYWYRNEPHKQWSVAIVLSSGAQFFPDFVVKVKGRGRGAGFLLVETKGDHILNSRDTIEKVNAEHKVYGPALFLKQDAQGRLMTVRHIEKADRCEEDQVFRVEHLAGYGG
jgi:type III restriction enzyme